MLTTTTLGTLALIVSICGVLSRLFLKAKPLYHLIPAPHRWIPDAAATFTGILLLGLPTATTWLDVAEVVGGAVLMAALAAAPGAKTPHDEEPQS